MEEPLANGEIGSELTGFNKGDKDTKKKQLIIGAGIGIAVAILLLILIIVLANSGSSDQEQKERTSSPIGEINLIYDIQNIKEPTALLGKDYNKELSDFDIYVNGNIIKYSKEYKFEKLGRNQVQIKLYSNLNMDYMFNKKSKY